MIFIIGLILCFDLFAEMTIEKVQENKVIVAKRDGSPLKLEDLILVYRGSGLFAEVIAQGMVFSLPKNGEVLVELDPALIKKAPQVGDRLVPIAPKPEDLLDEDPFQHMENVEVREIDPEDEPGYIELNYGYHEGSLTSETQNQANLYKNLPKTKYNSLYFRWFFEFYWRLGIEYGASEYDILVRSYLDREEETTFAESYYGLILQSRPQFDLVRLAFKVRQYESEFYTANLDEWLIPSVYKGIGYGADVAFEFCEPSFVSESMLGVCFQEFRLGYNFFPNIDASDNLVQRGSSSDESNMNQLEASFTVLFYFKFIPYVPRWGIRVGMDRKTFDLRFHGDTVSEEGGIYEVPEGGQYGETVENLSLFIFFRLDDYIGKFFMPN